MVDLCNFACVGDCKDRLIRNSIIARSLKYKSIPRVYFKRIQSQSKWVYQNLPNMKMPRTGKSKPYTQGLQTVGIVHQYTSWPNIPSSGVGWVTEAEEPWGVAGPVTGAAGPVAGAAQLQGLGPRDKTTDTVLRLHVNSVVQTLTSSGRSVEPSTKSTIIVGDLDTSQKVCRWNPDNQNSKTEVNHIDTEEQSPRLCPEWIHNPLLSHKWPSKSIS